MAMNRETRAEIICNLDGKDPNNEADWADALIEADQQIADGFEYAEPETTLADAQWEHAHWETVIARYAGKDNPLDRIQVEEATKLRNYWQGRVTELSA